MRSHTRERNQASPVRGPSGTGLVNRLHSQLCVRGSGDGAVWAGNGTGSVYEADLVQRLRAIGAC